MIQFFTKSIFIYNLNQEMIAKQSNDSEIAKQSIDYFHSKRERITLIKYSKLKVGAEYVDSKFLD